MTEAQGTQLIDLVTEIKDFISGGMVLANSVLFGILGALVAIVFFTAMKAVRRG